MKFYRMEVTPEPGAKDRVEWFESLHDAAARRIELHRAKLAPGLVDAYEITTSKKGFVAYAFERYAGPGRKPVFRFRLSKAGVLASLRRFEATKPVASREDRAPGS